MKAFKILSSAKADTSSSLSPPDSKTSLTLKKIFAKIVAFGNSGFFAFF